MNSNLLIKLKPRVGNRIVESDWIIVNQGVQQGTVLEPLVLTLYVNNFGEELGKSSNALQFADDTAILCLQKNEHFFEAKAQKILMETEQYMKQNKKQ